MLKAKVILMWTHSIKLPIAEEQQLDEDGFPIKGNETWLEHIPASFTSLTRQDEIQANQIGYDAEINVTIIDCNYSGQRYLVDESDGKKYFIQRTYKPDKSNKLTLVCGRRERSGRI